MIPELWPIRILATCRTRASSPIRNSYPDEAVVGTWALVPSSLRLMPLADVFFTLPYSCGLAEIPQVRGWAAVPRNSRELDGTTRYAWVGEHGFPVLAQRLER